MNLCRFLWSITRSDGGKQNVNLRFRPTLNLRQFLPSLYATATARPAAHAQSSKIINLFIYMVAKYTYVPRRFSHFDRVSFPSARLFGWTCPPPFFVQVPSHPVHTIIEGPRSLLAITPPVRMSSQFILRSSTLCRVIPMPNACPVSTSSGKVYPLKFA